MLWLLLAFLFVVVFVASQQPAKSTSSPPGADENAPQPSPAETRVTPTAQKTTKTQTMNNATMHTVTHGNKVIDLGSLTHSGELKGIKFTAQAKEQGWGNQCSSFKLDIMRGSTRIAGLSQSLGRNKEYKGFSLDPPIGAGTMVQAGDSVKLTIKGWYPSCSVWIKDIVTVISVLS